jgi:hypothetical protein
MDPTGSRPAGRTPGVEASGHFEANPGPIRLLATFDDGEAAQDARAALRSGGVHAGDIRIDDDDDRAVLGRLAQQREGEGVWLTFVGAGEGRHARGALVWSVGALVVGAVIGGLIGAVVNLGWMSRLAQIVLLAIIGGLALSSAGFVYGASQTTKDQPESGPRIRHRVVVSAPAVDVPTAERLESVLRDQGALGVIRSTEGQVQVMHDHRAHHKA